jgi:hypothetical protein
MVDIPNPSDILPDIPDLGDITGGLSDLGKQIQASIMQTITTVVMVGVTIAIVAVAGYLAYEYFLAPKIRAKKMEAMRETMMLVGTVNQMNPATQLLQGMS